MEQKINLKSLYKLGKSAGESHAMLKQVYGDDTVTLEAVYIWFKKSIDGRESFKDEYQRWRPAMDDNARPHTATLVKRFLPQLWVTELSHLSYSPDLAPPDFFLFSKLKAALKGRIFTDIQASVTRAVPVEEFLELSSICTHVVKGAECTTGTILKDCKQFPCEAYSM
ncbi:hypothetical protein AVEN_262128-1 [Araneus ventricosus]|uniref:Mos1 transposase HTH domain-containing protein n=1 Tax=Araneus ventricosus TaxID=182803 RepID=A0A4Y2E9J3_ARAVE|nr:hypothetical protein AVEN_262128-1 [Araneus ventricosus]